MYLDAHVQRNLLLLTSHTSLQVPPCWQGVVAQQWLLQNRSEQSCWGLSYGKLSRTEHFWKGLVNNGMGPWVWNYDLTDRTINLCGIVESIKTQLRIIQNFIKDHLYNFDSSYKFNLIEIKKRKLIFQLFTWYLYKLTKLTSSSYPKNLVRILDRNSKCIYMISYVWVYNSAFMGSFYYVGCVGRPRYSFGPVSSSL